MSISNFEWQLPMAMVVAKSNEGYKCDYGMMADPIGGGEQNWGGDCPPLPHAGYGTDTLYIINKERRKSYNF